MIKEIPKIGYGTWKIPDEVCSQKVYDAIKLGYRHIDCACDYGNEQEVGKGIKKALDEEICTREELWVTSKLWNTFHAPEHVEEAINKSLNDLGLDYLDLYIIHFPISLKYVNPETKYPPGWVYEDKMVTEPIPLHNTWEAMEKLVEKGLTRNIGVSNYNSALIHDLMSYAKIKPHSLQIESHPYLTQENMMRTCKEYEIEMTAFSPLGALSYVEINMSKRSQSVLENDTIKKLSQKYSKTPAQIVLRWGIQRGNSIIPKSTNLDRMKQNLEVLDFSLDEKDMQEISDLNCNERYNDPGKFCENNFGKFHTIYD